MYDPATGLVTRRISSGRAAHAGAIVGTKSKGAYQVRVDGVAYRLHRLVWLYMTGQHPLGVIDHMDGNPANNVWSNLRDVTESVNQQNQRHAQRHNATGFLGVTFNKRRGKFQAQIGVKTGHKYLGLFRTAEEAHGAYLAAKRELHEGCML